MAVRTVADVAEWRADCFCMGGGPEDFLPVLAALRKMLGAMPLLFTYRSAREGGHGSASDGLYHEICAAAAASGAVDLLDIELSRGEQLCSSLVAAARTASVRTVISRHDFSGTPPEDVLLKQFAKLRDAGADIPKLACMANTPLDVLALLSACARHAEASGPAIGIPMGEMGRYGRVVCGMYGSCLTFAALDGAASAPGQLSPEETRALTALLCHPGRGLDSFG